jgi:hypothetical protein
MAGHLCLGPLTAALVLRAISAAEKLSIGGLFSFRVRTAKLGDGPIFLRTGGFSPNFWTALIQYCFVSGHCKGAREVHFAIDIG